MKDMSVKELLNNLQLHTANAYILRDETEIEKCKLCEAELLRRFEELEKDIESWRGSRDGVLQMIEEIEYKNINLACCGNCTHSRDSWEGTLCVKLKEAIHCGDYRDCYECDDLTREDRREK